MQDSGLRSPSVGDSGSGTSPGTPSHADQSGERTTGPSFSIVVPAYNAECHIVECLDGVLAAASQIEAPVEVVVVDNGSTDGTARRVRRRFPERVRLLELPEGTVAAVRNHGARHSGGAILSFVDADCVVSRDYFANVVRVMSSTGCDATGARVTPPPDAGWIEKVWDRLHRTRRDGWARYVNSGNFVIRREVFEDVGGFAEHLETGEDTEICGRLRRRGYDIYEASCVSAVHLGHPRNLREFWSRHRWHGYGMSGQEGRGLDRVTVAALAHLAAHLLGLVAVVYCLLGPTVSPWPCLLALAPVLPVMVVVGFRYVQGAEGGSPGREVLLYYVYLWARVASLPRVLSRRLSLASERESS